MNKGKCVFCKKRASYQHHIEGCSICSETTKFKELNKIIGLICNVKYRLEEKLDKEFLEIENLTIESYIKGAK